MSPLPVVQSPAAAVAGRGRQSLVRKPPKTGYLLAVYCAILGLFQTAQKLKLDQKQRLVNVIRT
jgi:hypothetical protein